MTSLPAALRYVHRPPPDAPLELLAAGNHPAQQRLAFEELLAHHLSLRRMRRARPHTAGTAAGWPQALAERFVAALPFALTGCATAGHRRNPPRSRTATPDGAAGAGRRRFRQDRGRRLCGADGGRARLPGGPDGADRTAGRTAFAQFQRLAGTAGHPRRLACGQVKRQGTQAALQAIGSGARAVAVGTHALFQDEVEFHRLGLVIIDEQHRFGVHQRLRCATRAVEAAARTSW